MWTHGVELAVGVGTAQQNDIVQQIHEPPAHGFHLLHQPGWAARLGLQRLYGRLAAPAICNSQPLGTSGALAICFYLLHQPMLGCPASAAALLWPTCCTGNTIPLTGFPSRTVDYHNAEQSTQQDRPCGLCFLNLGLAVVWPPSSPSS